MSVHSASHPSLCIPRVFPNITWKRVKACLEGVGLGEIDRIDMVKKTNVKGEKFQQVYIHFKKWSTSANAQAARSKVLAGEMFKVTYDDPWFWKIGMSRAKKPERNTTTKVERKPRTKPTMSLDVTAPGAPKKATPDVSNMMREMELMSREMERLREAAAGSNTPVYQPVSPPYKPCEATELGSSFTLTPPDVTRQTGADIARELELELEGAGVEECTM